MQTNRLKRLMELLVRWRPHLVLLPATGLVLGGIAWFVSPGSAEPIWAVATVPVLVALLVEIVGSLRRGDVGLDIVAALSMSAALIFGEQLAAVIVAIMYAGGQYLESFAERRAQRSLTTLLARVPRTAMLDQDRRLREVPLDQVQPGDRLFVRQGDVVPVDGTVADGRAVLDQSALTGEALPVRLAIGQALMSGSTNVGEAFYMAATRRATESTYAGIVRLVEAARRSRSPMSRLADRYAMGFLAVTILISGAAWLWTGDPIRALAVLVVATPCPLILAVPVAIVSGVSRAAASGILVKGGAALETMARIRAIVIDKTGTLTYGRARLVRIQALSDLSETEVLRLAASLDQASQHIMARALVAEALGRGIELAVPDRPKETPGEGISGHVGERHVALGGSRFVRPFLTGDAVFPEAHGDEGAATVSVVVDGRPAGILILADKVRAGAAELMDDLRGLGIARIVMASGDKPEVVEAATSGLGLDAVQGGLSASRKVDVVRAARADGAVMMIGDGVNDAPALAAADLGVAMGANGAAAAAEAADVVLLADDLNRIAPAIRIARRSRGIALQSVVVGIGLSVAGMVTAAFGYLTPVQGALAQEAIDVLVILNALRALRGDARLG